LDLLAAIANTARKAKLAKMHLLAARAVIRIFWQWKKRSREGRKAMFERKKNKQTGQAYLVYKDRLEYLLAHYGQEILPCIEKAKRLISVMGKKQKLKEAESMPLFKEPLNV
jgi:hypothetical protein